MLMMPGSAVELTSALTFSLVGTTGLLPSSHESWSSAWKVLVAAGALGLAPARRSTCKAATVRRGLLVLLLFTDSW